MIIAEEVVHQCTGVVPADEIVRALMNYNRREGETEDEWAKRVAFIIQCRQLLITYHLRYGPIVPPPFLKQSGRRQCHVSGQPGEDIREAKGRGRACATRAFHRHLSRAVPDPRGEHILRVWREVQGQAAAVAEQASPVSLTAHGQR
jgi:hypothetical protein